MNEERDSQLSAMFDGELAEGECDLLARRLGREAVLRTRWERYALISATLQVEAGAPLELRVAQRVSRALANEACHGAGAADRADAGSPAGAERGVSASRWLKAAAGMAVAAGVAGLSILYLRVQMPGVDTAPVIARVAVPAPVAAVQTGGESRGPSAGGEPESYVVPAASDQSGALAPAELANYVVAHSEFSSPLVRRNLLTTLVTGDARTLRETEEPRPRDLAAGAGE